VRQQQRDHRLREHGELEQAEVLALEEEEELDGRKKA
jgi:hypothetical protein